MSKLLTVGEVATRLACSISQVYRLQAVAPGFPQAIRIAPASVRWREDELDFWLASAPRGSSGISPRGRVPKNKRPAPAAREAKP